jgi:hypothetical protein
MKEYNEEPLTKEIIAELKQLVFVHKPNFKAYDYVTYRDGYLELMAEERYEQDEDGEYQQVSEPRMTAYKKDGISGVYVGVEIR